MNWTVFDFAIAACLLVGACLAYELLTRKARSTKQRAVIGLAVFALLAAVWIQLAVGILARRIGLGEVVDLAVFRSCWALRCPVPVSQWLRLPAVLPAYP